MSEIFAESIIKNNLYEYGTYISTNRAIPDVRDGLKPVQRRILWSAYEMGLKPDRGSLKCAKIVGHVIGSYNPHGDCLDGETELFSLDGIPKTIPFLIESKITQLEVLALNKDGQLVPAIAHSFRIGQYATKIYNIHLSNGETIRCTNNHPFYVNSQWVRAEDLKPFNVIQHYRWQQTGDYDYLYHPELGQRDIHSIVLYEKNKVTHHKNGNRKDNRTSNLELLTRAEHARHHGDPENYLTELKLGRDIMFSENSPIREKVRKKNNELLTQFNKKLPLIKAKKIIQLLEVDGKEINEENYNLYRTQVYKGTTLSHLYKKGLTLEQLKTLNLNEFLNLKKVQMDRIPKLPPKKRIPENSQLASQGLLIEKLFQSNRNPTFGNYLMLKKELGSVNPKFRFGLAIKNESSFATALTTIPSQYCLYIKSIEIEELETPEPMYDFTVDGFENALIVAGQDLLVAHNSSCYEALVAMATPWTIKYPLIQSVGNFGDIKGHPPAAYRYTESGITDLGYSHFVDKKYLNFVPNFDGKEVEPEVLSSILPMILVNGYSGIALGFSGSIPSHNILDVAELALQYLDNMEDSKPLEFENLGPQLESRCYCLSTKEELESLYKTGVGTLTYCCAYELVPPNMCIVTGFAPLVNISTIQKSLKDLIESEMVEVADFTASEVRVEITMKDPKLFQARVLPALVRKESYQFHVVAPS